MHTPSPTSIRQEYAPPALNWQTLWMIAAPRLGLFLLCFLACILASLLYLWHAPELYESKATVQIEQEEQRPFKLTENDEQADDLKGEDVLKTIEQNLQDFSLFETVVTNPKIAHDPNFRVGYHGPPDASPAELALWLQSNTTVVLRHGTRLIDVTVDHRVPAMAQELAQTIIDSFTLMSGQAQNSSEQTTLKFLMTQSEGVKADLQKSENSLEVYKDSLLLKDRIDDQQRVIDALKQRYRDKHPQLIQARMLLGSLYQTFDQDFQKILTDSSSEAAYWKAGSNGLTTVPANERIPTELKMVEARADVLQRQVDTESALFDNVLKQMRETDVSRGSAATEIRLVAPPPLPEKPAKPRKLLILALASAAGVVFGVGAIALASTLDSSVQSPAEAEALFGLPVLCTIPRVSRRKKGQGSSFSSHFLPKSWQALDPLPNELVVADDPDGAAAEGLRSLRAVVGLLGKAEQHRTILFTSALPAEGKTFVSCNYALALAQAGFSTLLVDTDLRRPSVHTRFKIENKIGFVEVVTQNLALNEAIHFRVAKNLNILTAGGKCPNPAELLAGSGFKDTLTNALMNYDRIVFDCSPINLVSDSLLIAGDVDTVCLIVRADSTPRQAAILATSLLRRAQKEASGIVLNALPPRNDRIHLGYHSKYDASQYRQNYS